MPKQTDKELGLFFKNARHEQKLTYEELAEKEMNAVTGGINIPGLI